jgi:hypothetical protein
MIQVVSKYKTLNAENHIFNILEVFFKNLIQLTIRNIICFYAIGIIGKDEKFTLSLRWRLSPKNIVNI